MSQYLEFLLYSLKHFGHRSDQLQESVWSGSTWFSETSVSVFQAIVVIHLAEINNASEKQKFGNSFLSTLILMHSFYGILQIETFIQKQ